MIFIGVDPGKSGSVAFIDIATGAAWSVKNSETLKDLSDAIRDAVTASDGTPFAVLELVHSSPQMGVKSAFTFGQSYGQLEALLFAHGIRFEIVRPAKWQGDMKCRTKGDKNVTKRLAQQLFPGVKITHANADAMLLAEYALRLERGSK